MELILKEYLEQAIKVAEGLGENNITLRVPIYIIKEPIHKITKLVGVLLPLMNEYKLNLSNIFYEEGDEYIKVIFRDKGMLPESIIGTGKNSFEKD